jgi:hypothetical protein
MNYHKDWIQAVSLVAARQREPEQAFGTQQHDQPSPPAIHYGSATFNGANLTGANFTGALFGSSTYSGTTTCPDGIRADSDSSTDCVGQMNSTGQCGDATATATSTATATTVPTDEPTSTTVPTDEPQGPTLKFVTVSPPSVPGGAPCVFEGVVDGAFFQRWLAEWLLEAVPPGTTIVLDNPSVHRSPAVRTLIQVAGGRYRTCPRTRLTSTRSNRSSPSSRPICAGRRSAPSRADRDHFTASEHRSIR